MLTQIWRELGLSGLCDSVIVKGAACFSDAFDRGVQIKSDRCEVMVWCLEQFLHPDTVGGGLEKHHG